MSLVQGKPGQALDREPFASAAGPGPPPPGVVEADQIGDELLRVPAQRPGHRCRPLVVVGLPDRGGLVVPPTSISSPKPRFDAGLTPAMIAVPLTAAAGVHEKPSCALTSIAPATVVRRTTCDVRIRLRSSGTRNRWPARLAVGRVALPAPGMPAGATALHGLTAAAAGAPQTSTSAPRARMPKTFWIDAALCRDRAGTRPP